MEDFTSKDTAQVYDTPKKDYDLFLEGEIGSQKPLVPTVQELNRARRGLLNMNTTHTKGYSGFPVPFKHSVRISNNDRVYGTISHFQPGFVEEGVIHDNGVLENIIGELDEIHEELASTGINPDNIAEASQVHYTRILMSKALKSGSKVFVE